MSIADDRDLSEWKKAIEKDKTGSWIHIRREADPKLKLSGLSDPNDVNEKFNISELPAYIIIDKHGVILGRLQDDLGDLKRLLQSSFTP